MEWDYTCYPKGSFCRPCKENDGDSFSDRKEVLLLEFMEQGTTINSESYFATLKILWGAIQPKQSDIIN